MKVLVTGTTGFVGSQFVKKLNQNPEIQVRALIRKNASEKKLSGAQYEKVSGDLFDRDVLENALQDVDAVFHFAGLVTARKKEDYFKTNHYGTENLIGAYLRCESKKEKNFILISSLAASGPSKTRKPKTENEGDHPVSAYGESKKKAEEVVLGFQKQMKVWIIRPPMVYGENDSMFFTMIQGVRSRVMPKVLGKNPEKEKYYSVIYVQDLVDAVFDSFQERKRIESGDLFYVAENKNISTTELLGGIEKALGKKAWMPSLSPWVVKAMGEVFSQISKVTKKSYPLNRDKVHEILADYWVCGSKHAQEKFGFHAKANYEIQIQSVVEWYIKNGW